MPMLPMTMDEPQIWDDDPTWLALRPKDWTPTIPDPEENLSLTLRLIEWKIRKSEDPEAEVTEVLDILYEADLIDGTVTVEEWRKDPLSLWWRLPRAATMELLRKVHQSVGQNVEYPTQMRKATAEDLEYLEELSAVEMAIALTY